MFWGIGDAYESDVVSAVEDAIKDGVDIINYSASGSPDSFRDALSAAFMNAGARPVLDRVLNCLAVAALLSQ